MKDIALISLFDIYGELLTDKQKNVIDLHYNEDYSFNEIAVHLNITRQGVFESVKLGRDNLLYYENILGIKRKSDELRQKINEITELSNDNETKKRLKELIVNYEL
jgi:predicted DNA-binding protein YlxM (UPF0122 family)